MQETQHSDRPGPVIFTDGSRLENGATGYAGYLEERTRRHLESIKPTWAGTGGLRRRARSNRKGIASQPEPGRSERLPCSRTPRPPSGR